VDYKSLEATKEKFAIYADKVDTFALEANAMAEYLSMYLSTNIFLRLKS
jgi:hypothetical protein